MGTKKGQKRKTARRAYEPKRSGAGWKVKGVWFSNFDMAQFASTRPKLLENLWRKQK